ncbi:hypothetical protein NW762_006220 [Fusarium torreyae]|uniref:Beta-galactosidase domain-containing protein n=1 Tax=Fusarium torreyae TaxID=1237075 RepID=A0A9W8S2I2_9HYPO|nr:hypothetical protein NW762_006220 [Fusarium torreyae]
MKLQGQAFEVANAYLESRLVRSDPEKFTNDTSLRVTQLYVMRHAFYESREVVPYKWTILTSRGKLNVPFQDSKIHVADYDIGGKNLFYSSAEVSTWKKYKDETVLVLYGGPGETHEVALTTKSELETIEGKQPPLTHSSGGVVRFNWDVSIDRTLFKIGDVLVYLLALTSTSFLYSRGVNVAVDEARTHKSFLKIDRFSYVARCYRLCTLKIA